MYAFRDRMARELGMELLVHHQPEAEAQGHQPLRPRLADPHRHVEDRGPEAGAGPSTASTPPSAAPGATRRSRRAKERIFSFRSAQHRWDPKNQRPELWNLYNARKHKGESIRVFPMSNWTELDIWQYIHLRTSRSCRCTSRRRARWSSATAR
jgi:sulfate adenylyltransferase subunit 2